MLEAALQHSDVIGATRESNTWGPLSLDHVYEFMGGLNNAITLYLSKRTRSQCSMISEIASEARVQELKTIWVEMKYIAQSCIHQRK